MTYAKFEVNNTVEEEGLDKIVLARRIYERGNSALKSAGDKDNRALLLEVWRTFENEYGDEESRAKIAAKMPRKVKQRRKRVAEDGVSTHFLIKNLWLVYIYSQYLSNIKKIFFLQSDDGWEEVFEFIFPEDESNKPNLKILASAARWKKMEVEKGEEKNSS